MTATAKAAKSSGKRMAKVIKKVKNSQTGILLAAKTNIWTNK
jgi:hypothetical protein